VIAAHAPNGEKSKTLPPFIRGGVWRAASCGEFDEEKGKGEKEGGTPSTTVKKGGGMASSSYLPSDKEEASKAFPAESGGRRQDIIYGGGKREEETINNTLSMRKKKGKRGFTITNTLLFPSTARYWLGHPHRCRPGREGRGGRCSHGPHTLRKGGKRMASSPSARKKRNHHLPLANKKTWRGSFLARGRKKKKKRWRRGDHIRGKKKKKSRPLFQHLNWGGRKKRDARTLLSENVKENTQRSGQPEKRRKDQAAQCQKKEKE